MRIKHFLHMVVVRVVLCVVALSMGVPVWAQIQINHSLTRCSNPSLSLFSVPSSAPLSPDAEDVIGHTLLIEREDFDSILTVAAHMREPMPKGYFAPPVFSSIAYLDTLSLRPVEREPEFVDAFTWIDEAQWHSNMMRHTRQHYMVSFPDQVKFNVRTLPVPPKNFRAFVDPVSTMIVLEEEKMQTEKNPDGINVNIAPKHWITDFIASLQFSQAYISPNWYQGGTRNLNMIAQAIYNVKLNQKLHPRLMFEATVQYKLGMNSAPDDTVRSYNISEDLFQANAKFGLKAHKHWYYSSTVMFKTQLFNSYPSNSRTLRAAFMSPGELNVGVGMTYHYENPKKTVELNASLSPLSWNLRTCINMKLDPTTMNIDNGHRSINDIGSSAEFTFSWKIAYNIRYYTRLFAFTDYEYIQGDWEHTVSFDITRFLSTQIYCHMRYDSNTPPCDDSNWKKFQLKEIFSLGFNYKFSSI